MNDTLALDTVTPDTDLRKFISYYASQSSKLRPQLKRHFSSKECTALCRAFYYDYTGEPQTIRWLSKQNLVAEMRRRKNFGKVTVGTLHAICERFGLKVIYPLPVDGKRHCKTCTCHVKVPE